MLKRLIVNADDLGSDEARNAGIFEGIAAGIITSCSILSNGPAFGDAVKRIKRFKKNISFGIHLNLSEGKPLSSGLRLLTGPDGNFLGKAAVRRLLMHRGSPELEEEIRRELTAQIHLFRDHHIPMRHMDGHQHIHVFPAVAGLAAEAAKAQAIPWVRIPEEFNNAASGFAPASLEEEGRFFSQFAQRSRPIFGALGIYGTDHFRGLYLKGRLSELDWMEFLTSIPVGLAELMVHPGRAADPNIAGPFSGFSTIEREQDLEALIDGRFRAALRKTGVKLTPFPEKPMMNPTKRE
jgi:chitin disaccharide deacetylase